MKSDVKEAWLEALRSGEYEQGTGKLQSREGEFCCLGVLCDLAVKAGVIPPPEADEESGSYHYGEDAAFALPPEEVLAWAGLEQPSPEVAVEGTDGRWTYELVTLNDNDGYTFAEIATVVEAQPEGWGGAVEVVP